MDKIHHTISYIKYMLCSRHYRGDGVHSPFVFSLIKNVFREQNLYYIYNNVEKVRNLLLNDLTEIAIKDYGTGAAKKRKIADIAKKSLKTEKYSQLLFRLINFLKPKTILELGTSLGITTMYLAAADSKSRCITIEGCPQTLEVANRLFKENNYTNIESHCGNIDVLLPELLRNIETLDFVFFDANHKKAPTLNYFEKCLEKTSSKSIFVFDDIYWSREMTQAWKQIISHQRVHVSIDIFAMGIVFFDDELQKGDYILRF